MDSDEARDFLGRPGNAYAGYAWIKRPAAGAGAAAPGEMTAMFDHMQNGEGELMLHVVTEDHALVPLHNFPEDVVDELCRASPPLNGQVEASLENTAQMLQLQSELRYINKALVLKLRDVIHSQQARLELLNEAVLQHGIAMDPDRGETVASENAQLRSRVEQLELELEMERLRKAARESGQAAADASALQIQRLVGMLLPSSDHLCTHPDPIVQQYMKTNVLVQTRLEELARNVVLRHSQS